MAVVTHALANTSSMTSSIGVSSTVRSTTVCSTSSRPVTDAVVARAHAEGDDRAVGLGPDDLPVTGQVGRRLELDHQRALGGEALAQLGEVAVEQQATVVDDDHPLAQGLDVGHVVAGQQDRGAGAPVVVGEEAADPLLHRHVEAERRLVEEQHGRAVQQRVGDLRLHPLAEAEVAHRLAGQRPEVEQVEELVALGAELVVGQPVDRPRQLEAVEQRGDPTAAGCGCPSPASSAAGSRARAGTARVRARGPRRRSGGAARRASSTSSSCPPRSARGSRRPRRRRSRT